MLKLIFLSLGERGSLKGCSSVHSSAIGFSSTIGFSSAIGFNSTIGFNLHFARSHKFITENALYLKFL